MAEQDRIQQNPAAKISPTDSFSCSPKSWSPHLTFGLLLVAWWVSSTGKQPAGQVFVIQRQSHHTEITASSAACQPQLIPGPSVPAQQHWAVSQTNVSWWNPQPPELTDHHQDCQFFTGDKLRMTAGGCIKHGRKVDYESCRLKPSKQSGHELNSSHQLKELSMEHH